MLAEDLDEDQGPLKKNLLEFIASLKLNIQELLTR